MAEVSPFQMSPEVRLLVEKIFGQVCCQRRLGGNRSLSLGFGKTVQLKPEITEMIYGEWDIRTYYCAWRVIQNGRILCGSTDVVDSIDELRQALDTIEWGRCGDIQQLTNMDIRIEFDNGIAVDFLATLSIDEVFYIFCPGDLIVFFSVSRGWQIEASNQPQI